MPPGKWWPRKIAGSGPGPGEQRVCVGCHAGPERSPENAAPQILQRSTKPAALLLPVHAGAATAESRGQMRRQIQNFPRHYCGSSVFMVALFLAAAGAQAPTASIRFEEVTAQAGIHFTHSFGAAQLGSLLESTGAGAVWFDYNNDGLMDLYVVSGKDLGKGMHPHPFRKQPAVPPHNHLFRNDGQGKFTDVTEQAGVVAGDLFSMSAIAADYDNDGHTDLLVTGYGASFFTATRATALLKTSPPRPASTCRGGLSAPCWLRITIATAAWMSSSAGT